MFRWTTTEPVPMASTIAVRSSGVIITAMGAQRRRPPVVPGFFTTAPLIGGKLLEAILIAPPGEGSVLGFLYSAGIVSSILFSVATDGVLKKLRSFFQIAVDILALQAMNASVL